MKCARHSVQTSPDRITLPQERIGIRQSFLQADPAELQLVPGMEGAGTGNAAEEERRTQGFMSCSLSALTGDFAALPRASLRLRGDFI